MESSLCLWVFVILTCPAGGSVVLPQAYGEFPCPLACLSSQTSDLHSAELLRKYSGALSKSGPPLEFNLVIIQDIPKVGYR